MANINQISLSKYGMSLTEKMKERYTEKVGIVGFDPYAVKPSYFKKILINSSESVKSLPTIEYPDISNYLVLQTSWLSHRQMKAYKSLEAYNYFVSGWVGDLMVKEVQDDKVLVYARVRHSQRCNETPLKTWVVAQTDGQVLFGHCNCMAGLCEACSHVGAVLFASETIVRLHTSITCTQESNKWLVPSFVKKVPYLPVSDVDFSSAKCKYQKLTENTASATRPTPSQPRRVISPPSQEEINDFFVDISQSKEKPAILSVVYPYNKGFKPKVSKLPPSLQSLFDDKYTGLGFDNILEVCKKIEINITDKESEQVEISTRKQSLSKEWNSQRAGRITASNLRAACHTLLTKPSKSLIKTICYPECHWFSTAATRWGCSHESEARRCYEKKMVDYHECFTITDSGLHINPLWPHFGATPDGIINCNCCGRGTCEIKCPFCIREHKVEEITKKKINCLSNDGGTTLTLDKNHAYYYQVQAQIFVCNVDYCDFIIWTEKDTHIERILPDVTFWNKVIDKGTQFFQQAILPELISKYFTKQ